MSSTHKAEGIAYFASKEEITLLEFHSTGYTWEDICFGSYNLVDYIESVPVVQYPGLYRIQLQIDVEYDGNPDTPPQTDFTMHFTGHELLYTTKHEWTHARGLWPHEAKTTHVVNRKNKES